MRIAEPPALACAMCGYGVARPKPPERCPMCQRHGPWVHVRRRPLADRSWHGDFAPRA